MSNYNLTRHVDDLLSTTQNLPPSFTVHLKSAHWCLNNFNAGAKFAYNHQVAALLDDIRAQRIPVDLLELFDAEKVPFYEGNMIVEIRDHRPDDQPDVFTPHRVLLQPNGESLYADICRISQKSGCVWTDQQALEVEARILMSTAPPLCLDPDPHLTRAVNSILRVSVPTAPPSLKRKASAMDPEETAFEKVRRAKIMQFMKPTNTRPHNWKVLEAIQRKKLGITATAPVQPTVPSAPTNPPATPSSAPPLSTSNTPAPQPPPATLEPPKHPSVSPAPRATPTPAPVPVPAPIPIQVQQPPRILVNTLPKPSPTPQPTLAQSPPKPAIPRLPSTDPHKQSASPQIRPPSSQPPPQPPKQPTPAPRQPTPAQPQQTQPTTVPIQAQSQPAHPQYPVHFQPPIPPANFLSLPPPSQKKPQQMTASQHQQMQIYLHQHQQQLAAAARYGQTQQAQGITSVNGTPVNINAVRGTMVQHPQTAGNAARPTPLNGSIPQTSRSPMPPGQQPGVVPGQHLQQPATVQQYNYAANPYMQRVAAMHVLQAQQAQAQAQQQAQQQAQAQSQPQQPSQTAQMQAATQEQQARTQPMQMMQYPVFNMNYAQMGMNMPMQGIPPGYPWQFRRPPVNGVGVNGMNVQANGQAAQMQAAQMQAVQMQAAQMQRPMQGSVQGR